MSIILLGCSANIDVVPQDSRSDEIFFQYDHLGNEINETQQSKDLDESLFPIIQSINNEDINQTHSITKFVNVGNIIDVYHVNNIAMKIEVIEIISGKEALVSINNREPEVYREGTLLTIKEPYMVQIIDVIFSKDKLKAGIFVNFFQQVQENYPGILIERNIGLHRYRSSRKEIFMVEDYNITGRKFVADYGHAIVEVIKDIKFSSLYQDSRNVIEFQDSRIYKIEQEEKVAWVSFIENKEHIIRINGYYDSIIQEYLKKYPSHLNTKTFCHKDLFLELGDSFVDFLGDNDTKFNFQRIDLETMKSTLLINNEEFIMSHKDFLIISDTVVILDSIEIDQLGRHRVRLCFS